MSRMRMAKASIKPWKTSLQGARRQIRTCQRSRCRNGKMGDDVIHSYQRSMNCVASPAMTKFVFFTQPRPSVDMPAHSPACPPRIELGCQASRRNFAITDAASRMTIKVVTMTMTSIVTKSQFSAWYHSISLMTAAHEAVIRTNTMGIKV